MTETTDVDGRTDITTPHADDAPDISAPRFSAATDEGEVVEKSGYHQPSSRSFAMHHRSCGCKKTTPKGAYRDVTVELDDGRTVYFYHQSPVVVERDGHYRIDACEWQTRTTKQRISGRLPYGYGIVQQDYEWYVTTPNGDRYDFESGMIISPE